jgi:hypothetical protein
MLVYRRFGVEHEVFMTLFDGSLPTLEHRAEFFNTLVGRFRGYFLNESVGVVICGQEVIIKNDFCTHVLELEFPPLFDLQLFGEVAERVFDVVRAATEVCGLQIEGGAYMATLPTQVFFTAPADSTSINRMRLLINKPVYKGRFAIDRFNSRIAATQIHVQQDSTLTYEALGALYRLEYLVPLFFSNSSSTAPRTARCIRPLVWRDAFPPEMPMVGFPKELAPDCRSYREQLAATQYKKDYSFVCPRELGTFEFRTACSQPSAASILDLIFFRLTACSLRPERPCDLGANREYFYGACEDSPISLERLDRDVDALTREALTASRALRAIAARLIQRLSRRQF